MSSKGTAAKECLDAMTKLETIHEILAKTDAADEDDRELIMLADVCLASVNVSLASIIKRSERRKVTYELT